MRVNSRACVGESEKLTKRSDCGRLGTSQKVDVISSP
jgi:hypothetical protein